MRPPVRERPVGLHQLGAKVLIAAILCPVIRADGMAPAGACRERPKPELADDRRGTERVRAGGLRLRAKGTNRSAQFRRSTRVAAADAVPPRNSAAFLRAADQAARYERAVRRLAIGDRSAPFWRLTRLAAVDAGSPPIQRRGYRANSFIAGFA
jgi:hypothetical protein